MLPMTAIVSAFHWLPSRNLSKVLTHRSGKVGGQKRNHSMFNAFFCAMFHYMDCRNLHCVMNNIVSNIVGNTVVILIEFL